MVTQSPQRNARPAEAEGATAAEGAPRRDLQSRVLRWAAAAAVLGVLMMYNSIDSSGSELPTAPPVQSAAAPSAPATAAVPTTPPPTDGPSLPASRPTRLTIPVIGVDAPFTPLSMDATGVLQPPPEDNNNLAGWYQGGVTPGELGNAIVAGHVDTKTGPAVFFLLPLLKPGSTAEITRADGTTAVFKVDSVETFAKAAFPDDRVYGETPDAELRIITCGGAYDHQKKDYTANVVVFAHLDSSRRS